MRRPKASMMCCRGNKPKLGPLFRAEEADAFTLVELLVVLAIIIIVLSFSIPAVTGISKSNSVSNGGRLVSNLMAAARSHAIGQRKLVRIEVATVWPSDNSDNFRKITIAEYDDVSSKFKQLTKWDTLPAGAVIETRDVYANPPNDIDPTPTPTPARGTYFTDLFAPNGSLALDTTSCKIGNQSVSCAYLEFLPTGALNATSSPVWIRVSAGAPNGAAVTHTARGNNYADLVVDNVVGRIKFSHP
jgi:type II secretory pathway pseudopilin PulG